MLNHVYNGMCKNKHDKKIKEKFLAQPNVIMQLRVQRHYIFLITMLE